MVTVRRGSTEVSRNVSWFKKVSIGPSPYIKEETIYDPDNMRGVKSPTWCGKRAGDASKRSGQPAAMPTTVDQQKGENEVAPSAEDASRCHPSPSQRLKDYVC
ncbi:hypothetical protein NDU88_004713 [Pleurodeles waltl]|uniref:Uncharacterized protein n=1 Tax=Pleurodeles waltl TaxID=8319 RepID=A0AAV7W8Y6_PLEWA|nr:hypothetical protein NDU88_004713 [Pleurodeles waltl]